MNADGGSGNYETFRDCLSDLVVSKLSRSSEKKRRVKGRKNEIKPVARSTDEDSTEDLEELGDFIDYLASEIFSSLPFDLQTLSYSAVQDDAMLAEKYDPPLDSTVSESILDLLPASVSDSLSTYSVLLPSADLGRMLEPVFTAYIKTAITAPPEHSPTTRATECEICEREHLPLTYHHLIPRQMHAKAVKRGWAKEWELNKVAWLCRACHSFVHRFASNEELAREWSSIEKLVESEEVRAWAGWIGKIRWKKT